MVNFLSSDSAIKPGDCAALDSPLLNVTAKLVCVSFDASTMFSRGLVVTLDEGDSGFDTKARNFRPLAVEPEVVVAFPLQEISSVLMAIRTTSAIELFFKPGTPNNMLR